MAEDPKSKVPDGAAVGEALGGLVRAMMARGKVGLERAATDGRTRLELRQLRKDRETMYLKLGRELRQLVEAGEITHPGMVRGAERIGELDQKISALEAKVGPEPEDDPASQGR
jgi:polyhydroxyalkanoate synthesis regulator phasin